MKRLSLSGIAIDLLDTHELMRRISIMLTGSRPYHIVTINPEFIIEALHNEPFHTILATADVATADGAGIILAARLRGVDARLRDRITGVALTEMLLHEAETRQYAVSILLKSNSLVTDTRLYNTLHVRYPRLAISIFREPYDLDAITSAQPRILFSALGSPAQEFWIREHAKHIPGLNIALGVGGTFDLISGTLMRAPQYLQKLGLEWAWRLVREPKRLPRILRATLVFPIRMMIHT